jgi:NADH:ubiquinone oxidoreductase subunit 3 (subunit A)
MKNVFMLLSALVLGSVVIQQLIGEKTPKKLRSRAVRSGIPPISTKAF